MNEELLNFIWEVAVGDYDVDLKATARRLYLLHSNKESIRFIVTEDYIEDTKTGLTWERDMSKRGQMTWTEAIQISDNGFKLPSLEDFKTLAKSKEYPTIKELEEIGFQNVGMWSWTKDMYDATRAYIVYFYGGISSNADVTLSNPVLCVRNKNERRRN